MNEEKMIKLSEVLSEDVEWAKELLQIEPEEAAKVLEEKGYSYTAEELKAYADVLVKICKSEGELDEGDLDAVAGGAWRRVVGQTMIDLGIAIIAATVPLW